ncbi:uncharacterized protein [Typha latifolia]|uniref:uncharacterized protein isoform X1 n=1 Tax=Typha latifolia TaxID=4733 RepID=UPI003C2C904E
MINLFELSTGMPGAKLFNDRSQREGSPVQRNCPDLKGTADFAGVHIDDKQAASDLRKSYSCKESGGTPMKMLIAQEMSNETESRRKPASIVARLMGLDDDLPAQQLVLPATKRKSKHTISSGAIRGHNQQEGNYFDNPLPYDIHPFSNERVEYKDVYEAWHQPSRVNHLHDQPLQKVRYAESLNEKRMDIVRQKFIEAKSLATDEKLLQSKEFQDALEVLSSNRDLFLKFLEEPNSLFSKQAIEFPTITPTPQTKRITVLKPSKSIEKKDEEQMKRQQYPVLGASIWERNKPQRVPGLTHMKEEKISQPTRIVVLKPSPAMAHDLKSMVTPPITPTELIGQNDIYGSFEDTEGDIGSREIARGNTRQTERCHRRDESLISSACSYGYGGDESSSNKSENGYIEEEGDFSDSELVTPTSHHSWDYVHRFGSPYSASSFSKASYSPESLVTKEAKKRLSERWAMVASNEIAQEQMQVLRSPSTLGEMLAIADVKKTEVGDKRLVSSSHSCGTEDELRVQATCLSIGRKRDGEEARSPMNLSRSQSVPVSSSTYENVDMNIRDVNSQDSKSIMLSNTAKLKNEKSFFKGMVSNFFFTRSKKQGRKKSIPSPSVGSDEKLESPSGGTSLISLPDESPVKNTEEVIENASSSTPVSRSELGTLSFKAILSLEKPTSYISPTTNRDQPSPTSVLDVSFEDVSGNEPHSSGSINCGNQEPLSRSSPIESVARSLSWEDVHLETPSPNPSKLYKAFSEEDDEDERYRFVQRLLSYAGLANEKSNTVLSRWHSLDCPLNPTWLEKFLDRKEEAAKCRERRSNQRLLFDCVNVALLEIGQHTLKSLYLWTDARRVIHTSPGAPVIDEVWGRVRSWFSDQGKCAGETDNASLVVDRAIRKEVEGRGWPESMILEIDETSKEIGDNLLDQLVVEALAELSF